MTVYRRGRRPLTLLAAFALVGVVGCSAPSFQGTVTLDGTAVDGGNILFTPKEGGNSAGGPITNGKFNFPARSGLGPGEYRVDISWKKKTGRKVPTPGDADVSMDETVEVIPANYNSASTLTKEVKSGVNTFEFNLTTQGQPTQQPGGRAPAKGD